MFAGGDLTFPGSLAVGEKLLRTSRVSSVETKTGKTGPLVFVTVEHSIVGSDGGDGVEEIQTLVYRHSNGGGRVPRASSEGPDADSDTWSWRWDLPIDPTLLFRFSALTYNAHRIHYDRLYAAEVEGYPALVVHGPLQAVALVELPRRNLPDRALTSFRFRGVSPAFEGGPLLLRGALDGDEVTLAAFSHDGRVTMRARGKLLPAAQ